MSLDPRALYRNLLDAALTLSVEDRALGFVWWTKAEEEIEEIAQEYGVTPERAAYAAACLSPGVRWTGTLETLEMLLRDRRAGKAEYTRGVGHMGFGYRGRDRAWAILTTDVHPLRVCRGPKVEAVAKNLTGAT